MNIVQDPLRQIGNLQQCLSSDKKPIGLFLGAGCPMAVKLEVDGNPPLIPDIAGMTKAVCKAVTEHKECGPLLKLVVKQLEDDQNTNPTIEDILSHIRALRAVAGKGKVRDLSANDLESLDEEICRIINELVDKELPNSETPYHKIAGWIDAIRRERPVEIFTTNYDLLLEQAFEERRIPYFDGFVGARRPSFDIRAMEEDSLPPRWARLWKLHGSINWYQKANRGVFRSALTEDGAKRVIHPSHLKYEESRRMPYLAIIDRFRAFLRQPTAILIICGYSFRDQHINEVIMQGLQEGQTAMAFALLYGELSQYPQAKRLALERSNLSLLAEGGGIVSCREASWSTGDAGAAPVSSDWITWTRAEDGKEDSIWVAKVQLGDFNVFGRFVQELVGQGQLWDRISDGR